MSPPSSKYRALLFLLNIPSSDVLFISSFIGINIGLLLLFGFFLFVRSLKAAIIESQSTKFVPLPAPNTAKLAEVIYQEGGLL